MLRLSHIPRIELRAAILSLVVGAVLLAIKFTAYWLTESSAIFSDAVESIVNVMASSFALWSLSIAHLPADDKHPYGHGKIEFMSAGFEGAMILIAAVLIFIRTLDIVLFGEMRPERLNTGLLLVFLATLINGTVGYWLIRTGRAQHSMILEADGYHLLSDAITSVAALAALAVVKVTGWIWIDPVAAVGIAIYIGITGFRLVSRSAGGLMDKQDAADEQRLVDILNAHTGPNGVEPRICSYHKVRHRHSGRYHWVDFHAVVPAELNVAQGHEIATRIENEMQATLGEGNATAHIEPCTDAACGHCSSFAKAGNNGSAAPTPLPSS